MLHYFCNITEYTLQSKNILNLLHINWNFKGDKSKKKFKTPASTAPECRFFLPPEIFRLLLSLFLIVSPMMNRIFRVQCLNGQFLFKTAMRTRRPSLSPNRRGNLPFLKWQGIHTAADCQKNGAAALRHAIWVSRQIPHRIRLSVYEITRITSFILLIKHSFKREKLISHKFYNLFYFANKSSLFWARILF